MNAPESEGDAEHLVGTTIGGKYRVERLIGRGGMGAVYAAQNVTIGKRVALKFLGREAARHAEATRRFQREAQAASLVESEHIVQVFDAGTTTDGIPFLVMEQLAGEDLRARLSREHTLALSDALEIATQVLRALTRAHEAGIVHRDLKPDNLFLCRRDDGSLLVKIVDFGISKLDRATMSERLTRRGAVLGSAHYMSPEQAQASDAVDRRSDLYGVGAILFEMLAGRPPHLAPTFESVLVAICTHDAPDVRTLRPDVPAPLAASVAKALARDPAERFGSATEFLAGLAGGAVLAARGRIRQSPSRTAVAAFMALLVGFTLTALLVAKTRSGHEKSSVSATTGLASTAVVVESPARAAEPGPAVAAVSALPLVTAASTTAPSASPSTSAGIASNPATRRPGAAKPALRPRPAAASAPATGTGVARSLELSKREP